MRKRSRSIQVPLARYIATPSLRQQVEASGRRLSWIAKQIGVSKSYLSHILAGRRTISEADARVFVALIGGDFSQFFEFPDGNNGHSFPINEGPHAELIGSLARKGDR